MCRECREGTCQRYLASIACAFPYLLHPLFQTGQVSTVLMPFLDISRQCPNLEEILMGYRQANDRIWHGGLPLRGGFSSDGNKGRTQFATGIFYF